MATEKLFNPRKFKVEIVEYQVYKVAKSTYGARVVKQLDLVDTKPIFDLLTKAKSYQEKHSGHKKNGDEELVLL